MLTINLDNIDKLNEIVNDLSVLAFLQYLVRDCEYVIIDDNINEIKKNIEIYLTRQSGKLIMDLKKLVRKEDFTQRI